MPINTIERNLNFQEDIMSRLEYMENEVLVYEKLFFFSFWLCLLTGLNLIAMVSYYMTQV